MKWWISIFGVLGLVGVLVFFRPVAERGSGVMVEEVYVWQRVWTEDVREAVDGRRGEFGRCVVLGVEMDYTEGGGWRVDYFEDPLRYAGSHSGVDVAVRIGVGAAALGWDDDSVRRVAEVVRRLPEGVVVQLDYDCPTAKLAGYLRLLQGMKGVFPERRFEITCLPDWLDGEDFGALVELTDGYVMQVHGVSGYGPGRMLCDAVYSRKVAERCEGFGRDFMMALPTYRHAVRRREDGKIREVISEGGVLTGGGEYEMMGADVGEIAALVKGWMEDRPSRMKGVIWYRLPVASDRMNWTWETFSKVRKGEVAEGSLGVEVVDAGDGVFEVYLVNGSSMRLGWPKRVEVVWDEGFGVGGEGVGVFALGVMERQSGMVLEWVAGDPRPLGPGGRVKVGWVRLTDGGGVRGFLASE